MPQLLQDVQRDALVQQGDVAVAKGELAAAGMDTGESADGENRSLRRRLVRGRFRRLVFVSPRAIFLPPVTGTRPIDGAAGHARRIQRQARVPQGRSRSGHPAQIALLDELLADEQRLGRPVAEIVERDPAVQEEHAMIVLVDRRFVVVVHARIGAVAADRKPAARGRLRRRTPGLWLPHCCGGKRRHCDRSKPPHSAARSTATAG